MRRLGLLEIERLNRITENLIRLREERDTRLRRGISPRVGKWRHEANIDLLNHKIAHLEKKRLLITGISGQLPESY